MSIKLVLFYFSMNLYKSIRWSSNQSVWYILGQSRTNLTVRIDRCQDQLISKSVENLERMRGIV